MLILMRRVDEEIFIGDNIRVIVTKINGNQVHLAFDAPRDIKIRRGELDNVDEVGKKED